MEYYITPSALEISFCRDLVKRVILTRYGMVASRDGYWITYQLPQVLSNTSGFGEEGDCLTAETTAVIRCFCCALVVLCYGCVTRCDGATIVTLRFLTQSLNRGLVPALEYETEPTSVYFVYESGVGWLLLHQPMASEFGDKFSARFPISTQLKLGPIRQDL